MDHTSPTALQDAAPKRCELRYAAPITAFLIGPIAELWVIFFMTTGSGPTLIGWFGSGPDRGMALIFIAAGVIGLGVTTAAMRSRSYRILSDRYAQKIPAAAAG